MKTRKCFDIPGHAHELTFSTYRRMRVFNDPACAQLFLQSVENARVRHGFKLWAYVVMPEHVHLLICPKDESLICNLLRAIKQPASTRMLNHLKSSNPSLYGRLQVTNKRGGSERRFWQAGGGYDRNVFTGDAIEAMVHYIHQNPVRRALVEDPGDWPWSSFGAYYGDSAPIPVDVLGQPWHT